MSPLFPPVNGKYAFALNHPHTSSLVLSQQDSSHFGEMLKLLRHSTSQHDATWVEGFTLAKWILE